MARGRVCVVGAGSSGLAATKNLLEYGFAVDAYERAGEVGGNWNFGAPTSRVYASTHTISSKPFTQYPDFPMPDDLPDYPHHSQLLDYFRAYARHFELERHIRFGHDVVRAVPAGAGWEVTVAEPGGGEVTRSYDALVAANGHNWNPKWPEHPGEFSGEVLHSADYKGPEVLRRQAGARRRRRQHRLRHRGRGRPARGPHVPLHPARLLVRAQVRGRAAGRPGGGPVPRAADAAAGPAVADRDHAAGDRRRPDPARPAEAGPPAAGDAPDRQQPPRLLRRARRHRAEAGPGPLRRRPGGLRRRVPRSRWTWSSTPPATWSASTSWTAGT